MKSCKRISSKEILNHPRIKVFEDTVQLPGGKETDYIRFESKGMAVGVIAVNNDGLILMQREYSYVPDEILFQFPGGMVNEGENVEDGANRELTEEAKLRANKLIMLGNIYLNHRRSETMAYVFLATDLVTTEGVSDDEEVIESVWLRENEIEGKIRAGEITEASTLASWAIYKAKK